MKKLLLLLITFSFYCQFISAQSYIGSWKLKHVGVTFGSDNEMIDDLDADYLLSTGKNVDKSQFSNFDLGSENLQETFCENSYLSVFATFEVPKLKKFDLNLGFITRSDRRDGVQYLSTANNSLSLLEITSISNEFALEASLQRSIKVLRILNLTGGLGTNLGYSYNGTLEVNDLSGNSISCTSEPSQTLIANEATASATLQPSNQVDQCYDLRDGIHQRVFLQGQFTFVLKKRYHVGLDYKYELGYRAFLGGPTVNTTNFSTGCIMKMNF